MRGCSEPCRSAASWSLLRKRERSVAEGKTMRMEQAGPSSAREPDKARQEANQLPLPPDAVIILPVRNFVLFPGLVMPITIGRPRSIAAGQQAMREQRPVGILMQREAELADPSPIDLHRIGTVANVVRYVTGADGSQHLVCQGEQRFQVLDFLSRW